MKRIEKLNPEQEQALKEYHAECMAIGISTERADRARAEAAIRKMYGYIKKSEPVFVWCDSPATCILAQVVLQKLATGSSLRSSLRSSLGSSLRSSLGSSLRSSLESSLESFYWGQQEQYWIGFYRFMELHLKIAYEPQAYEHLSWWEEIAASANWWMPYENICFVSERPIRCAIDENRLLHHKSLAAMEFHDGWKVWAWHGVRVPQNVIESPETLTIKQISAEQNAEVRRVMVERMGWDRFCAEAQMRVLHADELHAKFPAIPVSDLVAPGQRMVTTFRSGVEKAELLEAEGLKDFENRPLRFVRVTDPSTERKYTIRVLHNHTRCYEALGWTFGMTEEQYRKTVVQHS